MGNANPTPQRRLRVWHLAFAAFGCAVVAALAGFAGFTMSVQRAEPRNVSAEGIVVLTGGAERIADAMDLVAAGRGKRLLITGVNPATRSEELSRHVPRHADLLTCCVDIDREATNTIGNAVETRRWATQRGFNSLIVVTSNYHMPRAMAEVSHQLPNATLIAYPVVTDRQRNEPWWSDSEIARTFALEYIKYIAALVRMQLVPTSQGHALAAAQPDARR